MIYLLLTLLFVGCAAPVVAPTPLAPSKPLTKEQRCKAEAYLSCIGEDYTEGSISEQVCQEDAYKVCMEKK